MKLHAFLSPTMLYYFSRWFYASYISHCFFYISILHFYITLNIYASRLFTMYTSKILYTMTV